MEVSGQPHALATYPVKEPQYPSTRRLGGPQSPSERFGEEENTFPVPGFEPRTVQSGSIVVILSNGRIIR
jgi:hypothetical protein